MARITPRVRELLEALMSAGFGWVAAEIIEAIESGRREPDDLTTLDEIAASRRQLDAGGGGEGERRPPRQDRSPVWEPLDDFEQAELALDAVTSRILDAVEMNVRSAALLSEVVGRPVQLATLTREYPQTIDLEQAQDAARQIRALRDILRPWLRGEPV